MTKTDIAYEYIKRKIITGDYPPMYDISEEEVQKELEISRTPVREAILRLEKEDFVHVYSRKGTIVTDITMDLLDDIYEIREMFEPQIAVDSMPIITRDWVIKMKEELENPDSELTKEGRREYFLKLDTELHSTLTQGTSNRYVKQIISTIRDQNERLRYIGSIVDTDVHAVQEHIKIINALYDNDPQMVYQALLEHLRAAKERMVVQIRYNKMKC